MQKSAAFFLFCLAILNFVSPAHGAGNGWWRTNGRQILDSNGEVVRIAGVNWFGMETTSFAPHGLWVRNYREMLDQIKGSGFNTIRLPFSNQLFDAGSQPNGVDFALNPDLEGIGGLEILDRIVTHAGRIGLKIILDRHRPDANGQSHLWYTSEYTEARWLADWQMLAERYKDDPTIVGADLHNEPRNPSCWGCGDLAVDWRLAAQRAGNAILSKNRNWLIVVEGVESIDGKSYWWGGHLGGVAKAPVVLDVANRVVYSPHDYPGSLYPQTWFSASNYPNNLPAIWKEHWGYIAEGDIAPVLLGEFGTKLETDSDRLWLGALTKYLGVEKTGFHWLFWSWNPNSQDTYGLLKDDWKTLDEKKVTYLKPLQFPLEIAARPDVETPSPGTPPPTPPVPSPEEPAPTPVPEPVVEGDPTFCHAFFRVFDNWGPGYIADLKVTNHGAGPINGWTVSWDLTPGVTVVEIWNARKISQSGSQIAVTDARWNAELPEKSNISFGFTAQYSTSIAPIKSVQLNGFSCALQR